MKQPSSWVRAIAATALVFFVGTSACAQTAPPAKAEPRRPDVIFVPTPYEVVEEMFKVANVGPNDVLYDLGSGDGRIPITAAKKFGTRGLGIDIDPERIKEAHENLKNSGVADKVKFVQGDLFELDLTPATVITLYLLPALNLKLRPTILKLKPGTRIVSHDFDMGDWKPDQTIKVGTRTVYYWTVPDRATAARINKVDAAATK
ncbi:MAG TPA: methyltransferase domain-containing protein [Casimicrobiaceae bacterium]|nr:methyltransferase domain-containing protein [Casimicrobiaceae bacterium]